MSDDTFLPGGPVGAPPTSVLAPGQMAGSAPASASGSDAMFTGMLMGALSQPCALVANTCTVPGPDAPQSTVMLLVPSPLVITPPLTLQEKSAPGMAVVL